MSELIDLGSEHYRKIYNKIDHIITVAHRGQKYGNKDYTYHLYGVVVEALGMLEEVALNYNKNNPLITLDIYRIAVVSLLHDAVEDDKSWTIDLNYLKSEGFDDEIVFAIDCITKRPDENYQDYIQRVKSSKYAHFVKIADSRFNLNESKGLGDSGSTYSKSRIKKYSKNLEILEVDLPNNFDFNNTIEL